MKNLFSDQLPQYKDMEALAAGDAGANLKKLSGNSFHVDTANYMIPVLLLNERIKTRIDLQFSDKQTMARYIVGIKNFLDESGIEYRIEGGCEIHLPHDTIISFQFKFRH